MRAASAIAAAVGVALAGPAASQAAAQTPGHAVIAFTLRVARHDLADALGRLGPPSTASGQ
jgi:hypothetical protein